MFRILVLAVLVPLLAFADNFTSGGASTILGPATSPPPVFVQTQNVTVSNSVAETTLIGTGFGSSTLAAGFFGLAGSLLRVHLQLGITNSGSDVIVFRVKLGGTTVESLTISATAAHQYTCAVDYTFTAQSVGSSGSIQGRPFSFYCADTTSTSLLALVPGSTVVTPIALNTTGTLSFDFTVQNGSTSDTVVLTQAIFTGY